MSDYSDGISGWLQSQPWDYFLTVTTRKPRRDPVAFIRDIKNELQSTSSRLFLACEPFKLNHNLHAHGLLLTNTAPDFLGEYIRHDVRDLYEADLRRRFGISRVERIRSPRQVADYCTKYVTKLTDGDNWNYFAIQEGY